MDSHLIVAVVFSCLTVVFTIIGSAVWLTSRMTTIEMSVKAMAETMCRIEKLNRAEITEIRETCAMVTTEIKSIEHRVTKLEEHTK